MSNFSVAEAKNQLSELMDRAVKGEDVVITRHGRPVVELRSIPRPTQAVSASDLEWLTIHRVGGGSRPVDAGKLVSDMRDADER